MLMENGWSGVNLALESHDSSGASDSYVRVAGTIARSYLHEDVGVMRSPYFADPPPEYEN